MTWTWQFEPDTEDAEQGGPFASQSDAESWLGESWRQLAAVGVAGATLLHEGKRVYGPMPLSE